MDKEVLRLVNKRIRLLPPESVEKRKNTNRFELRILTVDKKGYILAAETELLVDSLSPIQSISLNGKTLEIVNKNVNITAGSYIFIGGNKFEYKPIIGNDGEEFQIGDLAINGWISQNSFGRVLSYAGGDPTDINSWIVVESI